MTTWTRLLLGDRTASAPCIRVRLFFKNLPSVKTGDFYYAHVPFDCYR